MRLAAADRAATAGRAQRCGRRVLDIDLRRADCRDDVAFRRSARCRCSARPAADECATAICCIVSVTSSTPPVSAEGEAVALMDRKAAAQIRQREGALAVAAIGGADQVEQGLVFGDRQQLSLAEHPAGRREIAGEHADFANIRLCHGCVSSVRRREDALQGDAEVDASGTAAC